MDRLKKIAGRALWFALTIAWILAFDWLVLCEAAKADGFYIEAGLSIHDQVSRRASTTYYTIEPKQYRDGIRYALTPVDVAYRSPYDINETRNPYGHVAFGFARDFRCFGINCNADASLSHDSSVDTGRDRGINAFNFTLRAYFGGGR